MTDLEAIQAELDCIEPPVSGHLTAMRRLHDYDSQGADARMVICCCGYVRCLATFRVAFAVAKHHEETGEEL
jgi:hypothetical protein